MPKTKEVVVAGKTVIVSERKIKELKALANEVSGTVDKVLKANTFDDVKTAVVELLGDKFPAMFPPLTAKDVEEAYPSELQSLVEAFIDLNFFALKRLIPGLMALVQAGLQSRF